MPLVMPSVAHPGDLPGWYTAGQCRGTRGDLQRRTELVRAGAGLCKAPKRDGRPTQRGFSERRSGGAVFFFFLTPKKMKKHEKMM